MSIIIGVVALLVIVGAVVLFRVLRIEKLGSEQKKEEEQLESETLEEDGVETLEELLSENGLIDLGGIMGQEKSGDEEEPAEQPKQRHEEQTQVRERDPLSNLCVGRGFLIDCQRILTRVKDEDQLFAVAYFDIDRFRYINTMKGVAMGDYVLTKIAQEFPAIFPENSMLTRLSADHFVIMFPMVDEEAMDGYVEQIKQVCEKMRDHINAKSSMRVCIGVAVARDETRDFDINLLINRANIARHCIKTDKSRSYAMFDESMIQTSLYGESAMDDYNENQYDEDFVVYYQPQVNLPKNRIVSSEALVRWKCVDEVSKNTMPTSDNAKIPTGNTKVVYQACRAMSRWRKAGKTVLPVMVNLSVIDLYKTDVDDFLSRCLSEFQIEPQMLIIVVDISIIRMDWSKTSHQFKLIKDLGVKVAVSGIDTGFQTLDMLKGLPIDYVKLHKSVAGGVETDENRVDIARDMIALVKENNVISLMEGVDGKKQAELLRGLGADMAQGLYCGKPSLAEDFSKSLDVFAKANRNTGDVTVIMGDGEMSKGEYNL